MVKIRVVDPANRRRKLRHRTEAGQLRLVRHVKAYRWVVTWGYNAVIVTAADHVDACAIVLGHDRLGRRRGSHAGTYVPDMTVWRATELDEQLYKPLDVAAVLAAMQETGDELAVRLDPNQESIAL
jgi:hypothetical protein